MSCHSMEEITEGKMGPKRFLFRTSIVRLLCFDRSSLTPRCHNYIQYKLLAILASVSNLFIHYLKSFAWSDVHWGLRDALSLESAKNPKGTKSPSACRTLFHSALSAANHTLLRYRCWCQFVQSWYSTTCSCRTNRLILLRSIIAI